MNSKQNPKWIKNIWKRHDFFWVYIAIVALAVGTSWLADEIRDLWGDDKPIFWWVLVVGVVLTVIGFFLARRLSQELSAPRHETFHPLGGHHGQDVLKKTKKVIMFLSNLPQDKYSQDVETVKNKQWDTEIASQDRLDLSQDRRNFKWQQNFRSINIFKDCEDIEISVFCSGESYDQFDAFKEIYDHHRELNGFKLHKISRYPKAVDINSLHTISANLKDEIAQNPEEVTIIDITSGTKQYSAAATLETIASKDIYILYIDTNNGELYHLYNVVNEPKNNNPY